METAFGGFDSESFNDGGRDDRGREIAEFAIPLGICPRADVRLPFVLAPFSWLFAPLSDSTILFRIDENICVCRPLSIMSECWGIDSARFVYTTVHKKPGSLFVNF